MAQHCSELFLNFLNSIFNISFWLIPKLRESYRIRAFDTGVETHVAKTRSVTLTLVYVMSMYSFPFIFCQSIRWQNFNRFLFQSVVWKTKCKLYPRFCKKVPNSSLQSIKTFSILSLGAHNLPFTTHCYIFLIIVTLLLFTVSPLYILSS